MNTRGQEDSEIDGESSSYLDTSDEETERLSFGEPEEKLSDEDNEKRLAAFFKTIQFNYNEIVCTGKSLEYLQAESLIKRLSYFAPEADRGAVRAAYSKKLKEVEDSSGGSLQHFILDLQRLVLAARATEKERNAMLNRIDRCIYDIKVLTGNSEYFLGARYCRQAEKSRFDADKLRRLYFELQGVCKNIKERKAAAAAELTHEEAPEEKLSDRSGRSRSRESGREPSRSPSPLGSHSVFSGSTAMQQAASGAALGTKTGPLPPRPRLAARSRSA